MPEEVYIKRKQMKEALSTTTEDDVSIKKLLEKINDRCKENELVLHLSKEADDLYTEFRYSLDTIFTFIYFSNTKK